MILVKYRPLHVPSCKCHHVCLSIICFIFIYSKFVYIGKQVDIVLPLKTRRPAVLPGLYNHPCINAAYSIL